MRKCKSDFAMYSGLEEEGIQVFNKQSGRENPKGSCRENEMNSESKLLTDTFDVLHVYKKNQKLQISNSSEESSQGRLELVRIPDLKIDEYFANNLQISIDHLDLSEKPIYIRTDVKSFSNMDHILIPRKLSNHALFKDVNIEEPRDTMIEGSSSSSSSITSIDGWNRVPNTTISQNQFAEYVNSRPKTFSGTINNIINNLFENPEGRMTNLQRVTIVLFAMFEAYRTIISSFLTVFVPQNCGGYSCTILQNIIPKDDLEVVAISFNTFMAFYFCALFTIERLRENIVKENLLMDKSLPTDKEYLVKMLSEIHMNRLSEILEYTRVYRTFAQVLLVLFFINAGISCVVIQKNYLNNTSITVFITNTFFMINRIHKALKITSSGEYNVYSAYRADHLIYNRYRGEWLQDEISAKV